MGTYWDDFLKEYPWMNGMKTVMVLEAFWHYCKGTNELEKVIQRVWEECNKPAVMCRFYIKFKKLSSATNDNGIWWITMDYAWCKKRGSMVVLRGKIGNGDAGDRACR